MIGTAFWQGIEPLPKYKPSHGGYEEAQTSGYPVQFITLHQLRRSHSTFEPVLNLRELQPDTIILNPRDAAGMKTGDTALVTSHVGSILKRITVTPTVMPGVAIIGEGAWTSYIEETDSNGFQIDAGGNVNTIADLQLSGEGQVPWNTNICKVSPWTGTPLLPDYKEFKPRVYNFDADNQQITD